MGDRRNEGLWKAAMAVLEGFEGDQGSRAGAEERPSDKDHDSAADTRHAKAMGVDLPKPPSKPLSSINLLYRSLPRSRLQKERERRQRHDMIQSLSRNPNYADDTEKDDEPDEKVVVDDAELEDEELDEFEALEPSIRLERVLKYLRDKHQYCFWCKYQYPDTEMEGCPGPAEDDHD